MNKTEYETVQETADRLGVTVRAVQKWAASGRIRGAEKIGRTWFIPRGYVAVDGTEAEENAESVNNDISNVHPLSQFRIPMPLMNSNYPIGKAEEYIRSISDADDQNIALAEYHFFCGRSEEATQIAEPYLDSDDPSLRFSASLICTFSNLAHGHIHLARFAMNNLQEQVRVGLRSDSPVQLHAMGIFTAMAASVLLHLPTPQIPPLEEYMSYLPGGLKLYACYILAHKAYLEKDYHKCLTIAELSLALCPETFPIAAMYTHIAAVMALVNLKRMDSAKKHMDTAWKLAQPDGIIEPFGEHHGLLQGMIEVYFKNEYPDEFEKIIRTTYAFSSGWRKIHNPDTNHDVADNLSTTEFTIAMLYNRGWLKKEIAAHMGMKLNTVQTHIKSIFNKLGINDRDDLDQFMLQ